MYSAVVFTDFVNIRKKYRRTKKLLKSFKTEINPTPEQVLLIRKTIGVCRYVYNFYIAKNKEIYAKDKSFVSGMDFSKWLNNEYIPEHPEFGWIKDVSSKAVKRSIMNAETAFKRFFKHQSHFPNFKKKSKSDVKMYFVKTDAKSIIACERHRIKIPTLGWVRLKEKGYLPTNYIIKSGSVSCKAGRYYVSVLVDIPDFFSVDHNTNNGIGIDLGIKEFATISTGNIYRNINRTKEVTRLEKKLKREQRSLSRMYENKKKGGTTQGQNIERQKLKVQIIHWKLDNIRTDYINKVIAEIVKTKPSYVTIEDLNVSGMMKNKHLSKAVAGQKFYEFRTKLINKCKECGIEVRIANRWYPSSKICHDCGCIKNNLKLSDRIYTCDCGYTADRDFNASLNLMDCIDYKVA